MMAKRLYLEDFEPGQRFTEGSIIRVDPERLASFAAEFDPQPLHLDNAAAMGTVFAGLAASGWHAAAITMRLLIESDFTPARGHRRHGFR